VRAQYGDLMIIVPKVDVLSHVSECFVTNLVLLRCLTVMTGRMSFVRVLRVSYLRRKLYRKDSWKHSSARIKDDKQLQRGIFFELQEETKNAACMM
jgi:ABC-type microcin C transport system permease subunit YejE